MSVSEAPGKSSSGDKGVVCVVDLGSHSRKRVKRLRRGEGRLMERVEDAVAALRQDGAVNKDAQTVVVVVRQKPRVGGLFS
jgi:hypothetical protein